MTHPLIESKFDELSNYIRSLARRWQADDSRLDDIIQNTIVRLLEENSRSEFENARVLWARTTNIAREEIAKTFAERLPVSGVGFQAHWTATKALQRTGGDPNAAYASQEGSSRVGRELMFVVSKGASLFSPDYLAEMTTKNIGATSSISEQDEDNIRVALSSLTEDEAHVLRMRVWLMMRNADVAQELGITRSEVDTTYRRALSKLRPVLRKSIERFASKRKSKARDKVYFDEVQSTLADRYKDDPSSYNAVLSTFTERQLQVALLFLRGDSVDVIAKSLNINPRTVSNHLSVIVKRFM